MGDTELEAAARAERIRAALPRLRGAIYDSLDANSLMRVLDDVAALLPSPPEPLKVGDTVTREDADRVPVGAILREQHGDAWIRRDGAWLRTGIDASDPFDVADISDSCWPMTVLWLPEPSDA